MNEVKKLKTVTCSWFPMKSFVATTILRWMIVRKDKVNKASPVIINHKNIHYAQERELWYIGFYLLYGLMYLWQLIKAMDFEKAYMSIPFEVEAYGNASNLFYLETRERYAWKKRKEARND